MRGTATHIPGRAEALVGKTGETTMDFDHGQGRVTVIGEDWAARSQNNSKGNLRSGTPIRVVGHDGITLIIEQIS